MKNQVRFHRAVNAKTTVVAVVCGVQLEIIQEVANYDDNISVDQQANMIL